MKKSKKLTALIAAVLMTVTMFSGAISAYAAVPSPIIQVGTGSYGSYKVTGYRSINSSTQMSAKTTSNSTATRLATTIVARTVDSKGNLVQAGGVPNVESTKSTSTGTAYVTSGSGNKFTSIYILYAGLYNNNDNQIAYTEYNHSF